MTNEHMSFIGQRADKVRVTEVGPPQEVEYADGVTRHGRPKTVEEYTMTCPECGGTGYHERPGEVVCEDCGVVISGDEQPTLAIEYAEGDGVGSSRGLEKMDRAVSQQGTHEPSI
jgi:DnaJ-class molecular chaperone